MDYDWPQTWRLATATGCEQRIDASRGLERNSSNSNDTNNHGLQHQPLVDGDWLCQWEMAIFDPYTIDTPQPITKKIVGLSATPTKFGAYPSTRASGRMGEI